MATEGKMKVSMLGREIEITREALLSDGYCLSTVNHAQRLASGPEVYVVTTTGDDGPQDTEGAVWLRGHIPFCRQCRTANEVKVRTTDYIRQHFPTKFVEWHQGRLSGGIMGQVVTALMKKDEKFMKKAINYMNYNRLPLHAQAVHDRNNLVGDLAKADNHFHQYLDLARTARVIMVETEVLFESWQLLGSGPLYEKKRLVSDFLKFKIKTPFPATYFAFSEGINRHLVEHFFDNMPAEVFGGSNIKGFLISDGGEQPVLMEHDILADPALDVPGEDPETVSRVFLWAVLLRAIQDKVFTTGTTPEFERERDAYLSSPPRSGWPARKPPEPFYAVRVNPNSSFRDRAATYGRRHINWSHRWEVAGHWRTYQDGRRVWIASYVKGPEDKPFVPSVRVYGQEAAQVLGQSVGRVLLNRFMSWVRSFRRGA